MRPNLKDIISNLQKSDVWKIQLTVAINFSSPEKSDEACENIQRVAT